jgi:hypothetical protein
MNGSVATVVNGPLVWSLEAAAIVQVGIALLNLRLVRILDWEQELSKVPLLMREVFHVHAWFISVTLMIFGAMTWRFAAELARGGDSMGRWLAAGIGAFWTIRAVLQVTYYSGSHWRGQLGRTVVHVLLLLVYGGLGALYLRTALNGS